MSCGRDAPKLLSTRWHPSLGIGRSLRRSLGASSGIDAPGNGTPAMAKRKKYYLIAAGVVSILLLGGLLIYSIGSLSGSGTGTSPLSSAATSFSSTSYDVTAPSLIGVVGSHPPDGYVQTSSKQLKPNESGLASGGYGYFSPQDGGYANMTILVFDAQQPAQTYTSSVIDNMKGLSGYTDVTRLLSNYGHYGTCYGVGEADPDGNGAIAYGICSKGNVYIRVLVVSPNSLPVAEGNMADFVGAAYQSIG
jgi:hypothetical protein